MSQAKLTEVVQIPNGYLQISLSGIRLSGGQRQSALARSFSWQNILVFDEATSALDLDTEAEVVNEIKKWKA